MKIRNAHGQFPAEMSHNTKIDDTDDTEDDKE
jgi:hypothetical protein